MRLNYDMPLESLTLKTSTSVVPIFIPYNCVENGGYFVQGSMPRRARGTPDLLRCASMCFFYGQSLLHPSWVGPDPQTLALFSLFFALFVG